MGLGGVYRPEVWVVARRPFLPIVRPDVVVEAAVRVLDVDPAAVVPVVAVDVRLPAVLEAPRLAPAPPAAPAPARRRAAFEGERLMARKMSHRPVPR